MKKFLALMLVVTMLFSFTSVYAATDTVKEQFVQVLGNQRQSGATKMELKLSAGGSVFEQDEEMQMLKDVINEIGVNYDINVIGNDEQTKIQAEGSMAITSEILAELTGAADAMEFCIWLDMDITDIENPEYYMIMHEPVYNTYMVANMSDGIDIAAEFKNFLGNSEIAEKLCGGIDFDVDFANKKYTMTMTDKQVKEAIAKAYMNLTEIVPEFGITQEEITETNEELLPIMAKLSDVQLFDKDKAIVISCDEKGNNISMEFNIDTNIYDLIEIFDPESITDENRDEWNIKLSLKMTAEYDELPQDFVVEYPVLTPDNCSNFISFYADYLFEGADLDTPVTVNYEGEQIVFDEAPVLIADRTMVPVRALANAIGITDIEYDEETERIVLRDETTEIIMYVNSEYAYLNGELKFFDVPAVENNGRTYIPARAISEFFNKNVDYTDLAENGGFGLIVDITD